ncbi:MAG: hypothetical protein K2F91_04635 [Muribaculaceae bacterium]|nr:hypothetical protein [Muribaculaceae bacterium]
MSAREKRRSGTGRAGHLWHEAHGRRPEDVCADYLHMLFMGQIRYKFTQKMILAKHCPYKIGDSFENFAV